MRYQVLSITLTVLFSATFTFAADAPMPASQPATQPAPTRISIDLDKAAPADAINKLALATNLPMKWNGNRPGKAITIHATNQPLLDVIGDLCMQGQCIPNSNNGPGSFVFTGSLNPLLGINRPTETSLIIMQSINCQNRLDLNNPSDSSEYWNLQSTLVFDPAAQVVSVRGMDIDRVQAQDGSIHTTRDNNSWNQMVLRMDPLNAWNLQAQANVQAQLGTKIKIFGVIRAYTLQDFTDLTIDSPRSAGKSFGTAELKCTVTNTGNADNISLQLEGSLVVAYGSDRLSQMLRQGTVTALDENDLPLELRSQANPQGSGVQLVLNPAQGSWKDAGPASVKLRIPRAAHQLAIPVEIDNLPAR